MAEKVTIGNCELWHGDCLTLMANIPDGSVDMILCDMPYGTTACKWDSVINLDALWGQYRRIAKRNAAIVLTAAQPFTYVLAASNLGAYKHRWVWNKRKPGSGLRAKYEPLRNTEDVLVFSFGTCPYYPQMIPKKPRKENKFDSNGEAFGGEKVARHHDNGGFGYPNEIIDISNADQRMRKHPTQKPVALMEYLIRTYTKEGDVVLDNTMGSGTAGVASANTGRRFIGIEQNASYFQTACDRIAKVGAGETAVQGDMLLPANAD